MSQRTGYVVYHAATGLNVRQITKDNWASVGVEHPTVTWGPSNNWKVPARDISDEAWPYIEADEGLRHEDDRASVSEQEVRGTDQSGSKRRAR